MEKNKPTLADVALKAGVSMMTVSRAINNKGKINPETRERILAIAAEIGYRPNYLARSLATNRSATIGLVVPDISNPFFSEIAKGVEDAAHEEGYNVFLCNFDEDPKREQAALVSLAEKQVDGVILCSSRQETEALRESLGLFQQVVLVNRSLPEAEGQSHSLILDDFHAAELAVQHFITHGRGQIALLSGPEHARSAGEKQAGYKAALAKAGRPIQDEYIRHSKPTMASGKAMMADLLEGVPAVDAVLAFNDLVAIGAVLACQEAGKAIPDDLEIIGFDDIPLSSLFQPGISTLTYPKKEIGAAAVNNLIAMLTGEAEIPETVTYTHQLVYRQSSPR